jgi:hypothetical protein
LGSMRVTSLPRACSWLKIFSACSSSSNNQNQTGGCSQLSNCSLLNGSSGSSTTPCDDDWLEYCPTAVARPRVCTQLRAAG